MPQAGSGPMNACSDSVLANYHGKTEKMETGAMDSVSEFEVFFFTLQTASSTNPLHNM
jgi:hypothetical protein